MITLRELFDTYMRLHGRPHCRSWRNLERCFESYLSHWAERDASSIRKIEVHELHARLGETVGKTTANRVVQLLRPLYNKGLEWELLASKNPAIGIKMFELQSRGRFLEKSEIDRFMTAVQTLRYKTTRDFLLLCLLTAARRSNVAAMRWDQISFDRAVWHIPRTKNGSSQDIPLIPEALAILKDRASSTSSEWVFPSTRSRCGHFTRPDNAWSKIVERSGLKDIRPHDLRRTLASWQAITGANLTVIGRTLNHKDPKSTAIYARLSLDPVRESMQAATRAMFRSW